ncbi:hypothetical protein KIPB_005274 [Kipferlia bialata]|uniref:Uncharacterized protein n=1 Tax=Kipferlia bialata TaxID=797122 RepID=A0A391NL94_9EUKA|nr:hypothetical protein KIPB_005274 [Kipferlia bialata]|eukprot:g5274.t1
MDLEDETWHREPIPSDVAEELTDMTLRGRSLCLQIDSLLSVTADAALTLSPPGAVLTEEITYERTVYFHDRVLDCVLDIGPYLCLFETENSRDQAENTDEYTVYMYDKVSGEAVSYEPLPFSGMVLSACMLNPTTMLVLQVERTLVVELDPQLFNIYTDVD